MKKISKFDLQSSDYTPELFINLLIEKMQLKNDAALSRRLQVAPSVISEIRNSQLAIGASILLNEESGISIAELKAAAGLPRTPSITTLTNEVGQVEEFIKSTQEHISKAFAIPARFLNTQSGVGAP